MKIIMQAEHGQMMRNNIYDVPEPHARRLIDEGFAEPYNDPDEQRRDAKAKHQTKSQPKRETADAPVPETS